MLVHKTIDICNCSFSFIHPTYFYPDFLKVIHFTEVLYTCCCCCCSLAHFSYLSLLITAKNRSVANPPYTVIMSIVSLHLMAILCIAMGQLVSLLCHNISLGLWCSYFYVCKLLTPPSSLVALPHFCVSPHPFSSTNIAFLVNELAVCSVDMLFFCVLLFFFFYVFFQC